MDKTWIINKYFLIIDFILFLYVSDCNIDVLDSVFFAGCLYHNLSDIIKIPSYEFN